MSELATEHDYIGSSQLSAMETSEKTKTGDEDNPSALNLKATELRLGLPGSESPERVNPGLLSLKSCCSKSGAKRVFSDSANDSGKWVFSGPNGAEAVAPVPDGKATEPAKLASPASPVQEKKSYGVSISSTSSKAKMVGWPPIRTFRKNTLACPSEKKNDGRECCMYVKVSMEGAPYLRKIHLKTYQSYVQLASALETMFPSFTPHFIGQFECDGVKERRLSDLLRGSEYVVTYEDRDGDWMLVGDVPWEMFIDSCKKLRIMKSSQATGLAPRVMEKCRRRRQN